MIANYTIYNNECVCETVYENPHTVITREYPVELAEGNNAYDPINYERNNAIYQAYRQLAEQDIVFGGRFD